MPIAQQLLLQSLLKFRALKSSKHFIQKIFSTIKSEKRTRKPLKVFTPIKYVCIPTYLKNLNSDKKVVAIHHSAKIRSQCLM